MYGVIVPIKRPAIAKSRLAELGDVVRQELCQAFAADTLTAITGCATVARVLVMTDDAHLALGLTELGVQVRPDAADDLNESLRQGAAELLRQDASLRLAAVFADLPALRSEELHHALEKAPTSEMAFVADAHRRGSTTVIAPSRELFRPRFGRDSRAAHLQAGVHELHVEAPGLRHDVDTPGDLTRAARLGLGPHTSYVVTRHALRLPIG